MHENIYSLALSHLSEADRAAISAYQAKAEEIQQQEVQDSTIAIENVLKQVPGARRALRHYDREVGKLMRDRA